MKKRQRRCFYKDQKDGRMASMRGIDKLLHGQLLRHQKRLQYQFATVKCTETEQTAKICRKNCPQLNTAVVQLRHLQNMIFWTANESC